MRRTIAVAALLTSSQLFAQTDTAGKTLNEVIVTANKFPQKQFATGKVVTVIGREQIEKNVGRSLGQLLNEQAGITIAGALNALGTNQTIYMRGAASGRALILLDGIPVSDPSYIQNEFDLNLFSLQDIERIEVCRGAQSTLYGSDAIAGVINIITTKSNVTKPVNVKATVSGGNYGTFKGNAQLYGKQGKLTYTTRYSKLRVHGFSAANDKDNKGGFDNDGYDGDLANAALQFQATPEFMVKSFVQYTRYENELDASAFTDDRDYTIKNKGLFTGAGFQYNKSILRLTGNYQFSHINRNYRNDSTVRGTSFNTDDYSSKGQFAELYANIELGKNFSLLQGADYRYSSYNSKYLSISSFGPFTSSFNDTSHSQASLYASLFYKGLNDRLNIELGGRLNVHSEYGSNRTMTFNPSFAFSEHFRAFGSIATGFKAPSLYQLYGGFSGNPALDPERSTTYELGVQQQHNTISTRLVYFHRNIKNGIDYNYVTSKYFNFYKQTVDGIEFETKYNPTKALSISANYTYLDGEEETQSRLNFKDTSYSYLLRRPNHTINITAGYQFTKGLYVSVGGRYVSDRYDIGGYRLADVKMDSYFILNAYAEYAFKKHIKLFADAQNITDKEFYDIRGFNSIPFLFNGGITFNW
jgi:vitamin B12 transporter